MSLIAAVCAWLAVAYTSAHTSWSCEILFAASLAAYIALRVVAHDWNDSAALATIERGQSLFSKISIVAIPFVCLSVLAKWKLDSELLDWTVGRILSLQAFALDVHAERRWGFVLSAIGMASALLVIHFYVRNADDQMDRVASTRRRMQPWLETVTAVLMGLASFSIVLGPASVSLMHITDLRASALLKRVENAVVRQHEAWRVVVGNNLAAILEATRLDGTGAAEDTQKGHDSEDDSDDPSLGTQIDRIIDIEEPDDALLDPILNGGPGWPPPKGPSRDGGRPSDPDPSGGGDGGGLASALRSMADRSLTRYKSVEKGPPSLGSIRDLVAADVLATTGRFCARTPCAPASVPVAGTSDDELGEQKFETASEDMPDSSSSAPPLSEPRVPETRFGKVLAAVFDAALPIAGLSVPAPQVEPGTAAAFQDAVDTLTKDPLKSKLKDLFVKSAHAVVRFCRGSDPCDYAPALNSELQEQVNQTPGFVEGFRETLRSGLQAAEVLADKRAADLASLMKTIRPARVGREPWPPPEWRPVLPPRGLFGDRRPGANQNLVVCKCSNGRILGVMPRGSCRVGAPCD